MAAPPVPSLVRVPPKGGRTAVERTSDSALFQAPSPGQLYVEGGSVLLPARR
jgi:hypothetical protein